VRDVYLQRLEVYLLNSPSPLQEHDAIELPVIGKIPSYTAGILYWTGPYAYQVEDTAKGNPLVLMGSPGLIHLKLPLFLPERCGLSVIRRICYI
jgi:hypothetical protein